MGGWCLRGTDFQFSAEEDEDKEMEGGDDCTIM